MRIGFPSTPSAVTLQADRAFFSPSEVSRLARRCGVYPVGKMLARKGVSIREALRLINGLDEQVEFSPNEPGIPFGDKLAHQVSCICLQFGDNKTPALPPIRLLPVTNFVETDHLGFRDFAELHSELS